MAYDTPKAAHFDAYDNDGRKLAWNDELGLSARWLAARIAAEKGIGNLLRISASDRVILGEACRLASEQSGLNIRFAN